MNPPAAPTVELKGFKKRRTEVEDDTNDTVLLTNFDLHASRHFVKVRSKKVSRAAPGDAGKYKNIACPPWTEDRKSIVRLLSVEAGVVPEEVPGPKCMRSQADQMEKKDGESPTGTSRKEQYRALSAALIADVMDKQRQGTEIVCSLQSALDAALVAMQAAKVESASKLVALGSELVSVKGKLEIATDELSSQRLREKGDMTRIAKLQQEYANLGCQKTMIERELSMKCSELENLKRSEQTNARDLEQAKCAFEKVKQVLVEDVTEAVKKTVDLEEKLASMEAEHNRVQASLQASLETSSKDLEQEKELALCQMCRVGRKDTICSPCLHLQFCFPCLEKHIKNANNNTCPVCRVKVTDIKLVLF